MTRFRRDPPLRPGQKAAPQRPGEGQRGAFHDLNATARTKATVFFDGACSGNPGPMGAGAVVEVGGRREVLAVPLGTGTNNEAEYHGLLVGLARARELGASDVEVVGDSQLVIRQLEGVYEVKAANLRGLFLQAKGLLASFASVRMHWVPRERNLEADRAARQALGGLTDAPSPAARRGGPPGSAVFTRSAADSGPPRGS